MKIILCILFSIVAINSQTYELKLKNGTVLEGELDKSTLDSEYINFKIIGGKFFFSTKKMDIDFVRIKGGEIVFQDKTVLVNAFSKKIHRSLTNHNPKEEDMLVFESLEDAKLEGFTECISCFDMRPRISNYYLEVSLKQSLYGAIIQSFEVLYDHPKLRLADSLMNNVTENWIESLKYKDYRIEILKSSTPFSWSLPGGSIYISSELLGLCEYDEELEIIIAREVAHVERRHLLKAYQKSKENADILAIAYVVTSLATGVDMSSAIEELGKFSFNLLGDGFGRKLEEEADALAMIYALRNEKGNNSLLSILEKLRFRTNTRVGSANRLSAFSSAPDLAKRITQIKTAKLIPLENEIIMVANHLKAVKSGKMFEQGFLSMSFNYIFTAKSSTSSNESIVNLIGTVFNSEPTESFRIDPFDFMPAQSGKTIKVEMSPIIIEPYSSTNFALKLYLDEKDVDNLIERLKNKYPLMRGTRISRIKTVPGAKEKTVSYEQIIASYSFN